MWFVLFFCKSIINVIIIVFVILFGYIIWIKFMLYVLVGYCLLFGNKEYFFFLKIKI